MNAHERQQFDVLLQLAVERFAERLIQRNDGPEPAHARLRDVPEADGVWLTGFVDAVFHDALLDTTAGACFVLEALERRPAPPAPQAPTVGAVLERLARQAFAALLRQKTLEELERRSRYEAVSPTEAQ